MWLSIHTMAISLEFRWIVPPFHYWNLDRSASIFSMFGFIIEITKVKIIRSEGVIESAPKQVRLQSQEFLSASNREETKKEASVLRSRVNIFLYKWFYVIYFFHLNQYWNIIWTSTLLLYRIFIIIYSFFEYDSLSAVHEPRSAVGNCGIQEVRRCRSNV